MKFASTLLVALFATVTLAAPVPANNNNNNDNENNNNGNNNNNANNNNNGNINLNANDIAALQATSGGTVIAPGQVATAQNVEAKLLAGQFGANSQEAQVAALGAQISAVNAAAGVNTLNSQSALFDSLSKE